MHTYDFMNTNIIINCDTWCVYMVWNVLRMDKNCKTFHMHFPRARPEQFRYNLPAGERSLNFPCLLTFKLEWRTCRQEAALEPFGTWRHRWLLHDLRSCTILRRHREQLILGLKSWFPFVCFPKPSIIRKICLLDHIDLHVIKLLTVMFVSTMILLAFFVNSFDEILKSYIFSWNWFSLIWGHWKSSHPFHVSCLENCPELLCVEWISKILAMYIFLRTTRCGTTSDFFLFIIVAMIFLNYAIYWK